jgi:hypothetical protein
MVAKRSTPLSTTALLLVALGLSAGASRPAGAADGEEPLGGLYGISAAVGLADPEGLSNTVGFLGRVDLGRVFGVSLLPTLEYWNQSDEALGVRIASHDLTLGADLRVRIGHGRPRPYVGGGLAMHFVATSVAGSGPEESENSEKLGADLLGGLELGRGESFTWFVEAKYHWVSDLDTWKALAGVTYSP